MNTIIALLAALGLLSLFSYIMHQLQHAIGAQSAYQTQNKLDVGVFLGFILSIIVAITLWLLTLSRLDAISSVQLIFFLQALLFINFYLYVLAQDWALHHYAPKEHDILFFRALLTSGFAMMLLDFFMSFAIFSIGFVLVLIK